jgi:hypothetical protein
MCDVIFWSPDRKNPPSGTGWNGQVVGRPKYSFGFAKNWNQFYKSLICEELEPIIQIFDLRRIGTDSTNLWFEKDWN